MEGLRDTDTYQCRLRCQLDGGAQSPYSRGFMRTLADPAVAACLAARLRRVTPTQARVWGTMTPHQMLAHVAIAAEAAQGLRPFSGSKRKPSRLIKWIAIYGPFRWPHGVRAGAKPADAVLDPESFEAERSHAITALEALAAPQGTVAEGHPLFGPMSRADWLRWGFLHTDHHLRQFGL